MVARADIFIKSGDFAGHEFHGNQWTQGESYKAAQESTGKARELTKSASTRSEHAKAGEAHREAARAHAEAAGVALKGNNLEATSYHMQSSSLHLSLSKHHKEMVKLDKDMAVVEKHYGQGRISTEERERRVQKIYKSVVDRQKSVAASDCGRLGQRAESGLISRQAGRDSQARYQGQTLWRAVMAEEAVRAVATLSASALSAGKNGRHAARRVLRAAKAQALANWLSARAKETLAALEGELAQLVRGEGVADLPTLFREAQAKVTAYFAQAKADAEGGLLKAARISAARAGADLAEHHGVEAIVPDLGSLAGTPILGATLHEHFAKLAHDFMFRFKATVRQGVQASDSLDTIVERFTGGQDPVTAAEGSEAVKRGLGLQVRVAEASESALDKLMSAAAHVLTGAAEDEVSTQSDHDLGWQWVAVLDERTCPRCEMYSGQRWTKDYEPVGEAPEFPEDPPLHLNCFLGETVIAPSGRIAAVTKRIFNGDMVRVRTAHHDFTCTPNHPILTDIGWVAAKFLNKGSNVISYLRGESPLVIEWENEHGKTTFHELFESFLLNNDLARREVPATRPYFHGDGFGGKITIVSTNTALPNKREISGVHFLKKLILFFGRCRTCSDAFMIFSAFNSLIKRCLSASYSFVGSRSQFLSFGFACACHPDKLLRAGIPNFDTTLYEPSAQYSPINSKLKTNASYSNPEGVKLNGSIPVDMRGRGMAFTKRNTRGFKTSVNAVRRYAELASNIASGKTGKIEVNDVISVERVSFHGPVFNCETSDNFYTVNGIIAHNCRCAVVPSDLKEEGAPDANFDDYLAQYSRSEQEATFGKAALRAYRRGDISSGQLVAQKGHELSPDEFGGGE